MIGEKSLFILSFLVRSILEIFCLLTLIRITYPQQHSSPKRLWVCVLLYVLIDFFSAFFYFPETIATFQSVVLFFLRYAKAVPIFFFLYPKKVRSTMVYYYIIFAVLFSILTQTILFVLEITVSYTTSIDLLNWLDSALCVLLLLLLLAAIRRNRLSGAVRGIAVLPPPLYILIIASLSCVAVLENNIFSQQSSSQFTSDVSKLISVILTGLLVIMVVYFMLVFSSKVFTEHIVASLASQIDAQISHYDILKTHDDELRRFRHDYLNAFLCLKALLNANSIPQALTFIEDLSVSIEAVSPAFDSGNYIADALLSEKKYKASEYNVSIELEGYIPSAKINNLDLCIVLTNALDNAIEACSEINGEKTIGIVSEIKNGFWIVTITNPVKNNVSIQNNRIYTTKKDASQHGFGLRNMERVIKKTGGNLTVLSDNQEFILTAVLKLNEQDFCADQCV